MDNHLLSKLIVGGAEKDRLDQVALLSSSIRFQKVSLDTRENKDMASVRDFVGQIHLKPSIEKQFMALILEFQNLSPQTQNTLLKLIEEPPEGVQILITANQVGSVIPTISSRCQIIDLGQKSAIDTTDIEAFLEQPLQKQLEKSDQLDIDHFIVYLKEKLKTNGASQKAIANLLTNAFELKEKMTSANLNKRLAKEKLLVQLHDIQL